MNATTPEPKDLIALVADIQQEKTLATLLDLRCESLHIRKPTFEIFRHAEHDPGVYNKAGDFLNVFVNQFRYALVMLDAAWEGSPASASVIAKKIQTDLNSKGWQNRSEVIVFDPELEIWVWADSPHVPRALGTNWEVIRVLARARAYWHAEASKPHQPKELLQDILEQTNKRRSSALFEQLAKSVGLERCQDAAFLQLRQTLQSWFPLEYAASSANQRVLRERRKTR
jgi:hypothetical protein